jgi:hypothetical protein
MSRSYSVALQSNKNKQQNTTKQPSRKNTAKPNKPKTNPFKQKRPDKSGAYGRTKILLITKQKTHHT